MHTQGGTALTVQHAMSKSETGPRCRVTSVIHSFFSPRYFIHLSDERRGGEPDAPGDCQANKDERSHPEEVPPGGGSESRRGRAEGDTEGSDRWSGEKYGSLLVFILDTHTHGDIGLELDLVKFCPISV